MLDFLIRRWGRLRQPTLADPGPLRPVTLDEDDPTVAAVRETRDTVRGVLMEVILPFWYPRSLEREVGGYVIDHDAEGRWTGPGPRWLVPQARTLWFFSRMARAGHFPEGLDAARHGFDFLRRAFLDPEHGGVVWGVSWTGEEVVDDAKRLYGQLIALYAVDEYARVSGDPVAAELAEELEAVVHDRFHDPVLGGYRRDLTRSWTRHPPEIERRRRAHLKSVDDQLHVLETLAARPGVGEGGVRDRRILEQILLLTGTAVHRGHGVATSWYRPDWTPLVESGTAAVSYGHDMESAWLVLDACGRIGLPTPAVAGWCRALLDHTLRWGCDRRRGGVYFEGPVDGPAYSRRRVFWVQAESLVGALAIYRHTGDERAARLYLDTLDWVTRFQIDREHGGWHMYVDARGRPSGGKANLWKAPYHTGRAMMTCLELLGD